ncbi:MAG: YdeI/OmpD-associated family protein, partial [Actinomycetota bacterium]|nr:YdeI/OmpD-associated family protein [Actinomycetota bacterium]
LAEALKASPDARQTFARLAYTHQKEYVSWIMEAKRDATRRSRVEKTISMLRAGEKHP